MGLYPMLGSREGDVRAAALNEIMARQRQFGIDPGILGNLDSWSRDIDVFDEYAGYASTLGEGKLFQGQDEKGWLGQELSVAWMLRNELLRADQNVNPQLAALATIIADTDGRFNRVKQEFLAAEAKLEEIAEKRKDAAKALTDAKEKIKDAEEKMNAAIAELDRENRKQHPDRDRVRRLSDTVRHQDQRRDEGVRERDRAQHDIEDLDAKKIVWEDKLKRAERERDTLDDPVIPGWADTSGTLSEMKDAVLFDGGSDPHNFKSLSEIQGSNQSMEILQDLPPLGGIGGLIFDLQHRLSELSAPGEDPNLEAKLELERELRLQAQQRYNVSQLQYPVFRDFFGGVFHKGILAGPVPGRRGQTVPVLAQAGEIIAQPDQIAPAGTGNRPVQVDVRTLVEDGAVNEDRIKHIITVEGERQVSSARRRIGAR
jgi:hypothetical protein